MMTLPWIDQLTQWNPQVFRELKGRLIPSHLLIAGAISLLGQALLLISFAIQLPADYHDDSRHRYCTGSDWQSYGGATCVRLAGKILINWQLWWQDIFLWLSVIGIFALLVVGTYMLISDLAQEERRGTLNFVRLTPQSTESILGGKMLGVPILLYLVAGSAVPLHLVSALAAQISLSKILSLYVVTLASCLFFYSAAVLFSFVSGWLGGFQAWLGSGAVLMFLMGMVNLLGTAGTRTSMDWMLLFTPFTIIRYVFESKTISSLFPYYSINIQNWQWFHIPFGLNSLGFVSAALLNYGLWTYWTWQSLKRCFRNSNATIFSKRQSYVLVACFEVIILGFAVQGSQEWSSNSQDGLFINLGLLSVWNLFLFLGLIAALSPHRQALQDWARYRHLGHGAWGMGHGEENSQFKAPDGGNKVIQNFKLKSLLQDLIWGEKSPAIVAIALNLLMVNAAMAVWILLLPVEWNYKIQGLASLPFLATSVMIYAALTQLVLWMKTPHRMFWAAGIVGTVIVLPYIVFAVLMLSPEQYPVLWLFSAFPLFATYFNPAPMAALSAILAEWTILSLMLLQLTRQLRLSGASATKAMLAASGQPS